MVAHLFGLSTNTRIFEDLSTTPEGSEDDFLTIFVAFAGADFVVVLFLDFSVVLFINYSHFIYDCSYFIHVRFKNKAIFRNETFILS